VAIKAAYGGGGRGMKVVGTRRSRRRQSSRPQREAQAYFGRPEIYVERYLTWPRHIEMQVLGDTHGNTVWLGERDCSAQRRHQKLVEESPARELPRRRAPSHGRSRGEGLEGLRVRTTQGTVEFLLQDGEFYFLEMNTRLQVEHPVTELVTGLDLVEWQLRIASGEALTLGRTRSGATATPSRCASTPKTRAGAASLLRRAPSRRFDAPSGPGVRLDAGYESGDTVSQYYDNLIAKLIVWAPDRERPAGACCGPSARRSIEGVATTIPCRRGHPLHPDFVDGKHSTKWVEDVLDLSQLTVTSADALPRRTRTTRSRPGAK
jgi:acetyl-CoA/propionyl-CoA carboxylase biotin carboxyl carrier protein